MFPPRPHSHANVCHASYVKERKRNRERAAYLPQPEQEQLEPQLPDARCVSALSGTAYGGVEVVSDAAGDG